MTRKTLIIVRHPPHGSSWAREGIEAVLVGGALGTPVDVLFDGDGVFCLLPGQKAGALDQKGTLPMIKAFPMYDIDTILVSRPALEARGLHADALALESAVVEPRDCLTHYHSILTF